MNTYLNDNDKVIEEYIYIITQRKEKLTNPGTEVQI